MIDRKFKVLTVDDQISTVSQLICFPGIKEQKERKRLARELFHIETFKIVGEAIDKVKNGFIPDLSIIDINYQDLKRQEVIDKGYDPNIECMNLRGFDLLEELKDISVNIFYSANNYDLDKDRELERRKLIYGDHWFMKGDRGSFNEYFNSKMPFIHRKLCKELFAKLNKTERGKIQEIIDGFSSSEDLLNFTFKIGDRKITGRHLLVGWGKVELIDKKLKMTYNEPASAIEECLKYSMTHSKTVRFSQGFNYPHVEKELEKFKSDYDRKQIMDKESAQLILDVLLNYEKIKKYEYDFPFLNRISNGIDLKNESNFNEKKFNNSLKLRRLYIGLCVYRNENVIQHPDILQFTTDLIAQKSLSPESMRTYLMKLGLSLNRSSVPKFIKYEYPYIMKEEEDWINEYKGQIILHFNNNNRAAFKQ